MPIEGHMINGKFMDIHGTVYKFVPKDAVILDVVGDSTGTPNTTQPQAQGAPPTPATPPSPATPPAAPAETPQTPTAAPNATPKAAKEITPAQPTNTTPPKCVSYELLKAIQTPSQAQATVRAHCDRQFADGVVHLDFEVYEGIFKKEHPEEAQIALLKFKQTALQAAFKMAARMAKELLYDQDQKQPEV